MSSDRTRERILDAAEELFAAQGISGTSLRALTRAAKVNLAAVHYHFGSKEGLLDAVVARHAEPVNAARMEALDRAEARAKGGTPDVETVLRAFFEPLVRSRHAGERARILTRLAARLHAQPPEIVEAISRKHFGPVAARFLEATLRALPSLPQEIVAERFRFTLGTMLHVYSRSYGLDTIPGYPSTVDDDTERIEHLIAFLAAGLRASDASSERAQGSRSNAA